MFEVASLFLFFRPPADEDSGAPLLSVPPNVNFYEGLTPDKVLQGPPPWPGQMRPTNRTTQKGEETEKDNLPPPPQVVERAKIDVPTGGSQRMQVRDGGDRNELSITIREIVNVAKVLRLFGEVQGQVLSLNAFLKPSLYAS